MQDAIARLREQFDQYACAWPDERDSAASFAAFLDDGPVAFRREHPPGHYTASAWLVSADGMRILMTHHRKLQRWLQLGGHADGDADLAAAALREAEEESGLQGLTVEPAMFDLDRHAIPARGSEPEHWHYDVRYVVRAGESEAFVVSDESHALAWREIRALLDEDGIDPSVRRMAAKWVGR